MRGVLLNGERTVAFFGGLAFLVLPLIQGCMSARKHRELADQAAFQGIEEAQTEALGRTEEIRIESPAESLRRRLLLDQLLPHSSEASLGLRDLPSTEIWDPETHLLAEQVKKPPWDTEGTLKISMLDAIQIGARNARSFKEAKEEVFRTALSLDLEREAFRNTFSGLVSGLFDSDLRGEETVNGITHTDELSLTKRFQSGLDFSLNVALDLVKILTQDRSSSLGLFADASVSIPLLRGSGKDIVREPLTQAERDVLYAVHEFERFKRTFAVQVASEYLNVLQDEQEARNAEENYKRLIKATWRAKKWAESGKIPEFQKDQSMQDELRARTRWIQSKQSYASGVDRFKQLLGLPPDARVLLESADLDQLRRDLEDLSLEGKPSDDTENVPPADAEVALEETAWEEASFFNLNAEGAVALALDTRLDLRTAFCQVEDAQRKIRVASDALRAELNLLGTAQAGERRGLGTADQDNARLDPGEGTYAALIDLNLPLERTQERIAYRESLIALERAVRSVQEIEDDIKLQVRDGIRGLVQAKENLSIQKAAAELARERVRSTDLFLQAGRAEIRDVLEAEEALLSAENGVASALVSYRVAELELQRDLGVLEVDVQGLWKEYLPKGE